MNELFLKIINMSISASWLILAVLILRLVLKKAPKWVNVLLWGIVAVRLICPFSFESALSLIPSAETFPEKIISGPSFDVQTGITPIDNRINDYLGDRYFEGVTVPTNNGNNVMTILTIVWIIGILLLATYTVISYWRLHREIDTAVHYKDNIFQSENVSSPFVLGIINPRIYLPFSMNEQDMEHVVAHEQAHIRRKDHWWKPLGFLLLTIHWFNPLMWLAYVLLCRDIELACDEKVIKELGNEQRADYMQALVACSVNRRMIAACPLAFGEVGVKERVKSVMNYKKPAFWVIIIAVIVCVGVAVCFLTNPKQDSYTLRIVVPAGSQEEFVYSHEEVSTIKNSIKIWSGDGLGDTEVLLFPVNKTAETGYTATYLTHGMPVEFDAEKDTWYKIGVNMQNSTNEDIIVYVEVENVEVRIVDEINSVIEWFDYLETPDEMKWDGSLEISLTEFPDVTFRWTYGEMLAVKGSKSTSLYTGMPIWNAYFCDLTGDGLPELCSTISWGSGMIDNRVIIYDYANGARYELSDRGYFDFTLRFNEADGYLYVDKKKYNTDELVETGRLVFKNNCIQIEGFSNEAHQVFQAEILEIHDGNYLVKPVEGSWELSSADRIEVPIRNVHPSPEPEIGDVIEIEYAGEILETYPAQIADVYGIKVIEKNKDCKYTETFTNSAELGIISQRDFFDKDISNNENMNGYYVVRNGDFVYNPRVSTSAPVGPIKRNNLGRTGIMSPLYYIFHTHDIVDGRYLEYYFSSTKWHKFMKQNGDSGVRSDRLAIKDTTFIKMIIPIPSKMKEQRKVGIFFKLLDDTIILRQEKINQLIKLKTIFLKNMFI